MLDSTVEWARADIFMDSRWGKLSLGKGDSATRGTGRADLSATDLVANYDNRRLESVEYVTKRRSDCGIWHHVR